MDRRRYGAHEIDVYETAVALVERGDVVVVLVCPDRLRMGIFDVRPHVRPSLYDDDPNERLRLHGALIALAGGEVR